MTGRPDEPLAIVFLGSIGAGKSYFSRQLATRWNAIRLNTDAFRLAWYGSLEDIERNDGHGSEANKRISRASEYIVQQVLTARQTVIIDAARYNKREVRRNLAPLVSECGAKLIVVWIDTPRDVASRRVQEREPTREERRLEHLTAEHILNDHFAHFEEPQPDERVVKIDGTVDFETQYQSFEEQLTKLLSK